MGWQESTCGAVSIPIEEVPDSDTRPKRPSLGVVFFGMSSLTRHDPACPAYQHDPYGSNHGCEWCVVIAAVRTEERTARNEYINSAKNGWYREGRLAASEEILNEGPWCNNPHHRTPDSPGGGANDCPCYLFAARIAAEAPDPEPEPDDS